MLSYCIVSKKQPQTSSTPNAKLFEDAKKKCTLKPGERIKVRGTPTRGVVSLIGTTLDDVSWKGKMPRFILIKTDDGREFLVSPNQIKRSYS